MLAVRARWGEVASRAVRVTPGWMTRSKGSSASAARVELLISIAGVEPVSRVVASQMKSPTPTPGASVAPALTVAAEAAAPVPASVPAATMEEPVKE